MNFVSLLHRWLGKHSTPIRHKRPVRFRPRLEWLEDRLNPTPITVTSPLDPVTLTAGTLRAAVSQANTDAAAGISDAITFASGLSGATITLGQGELELSGAGGGTITIDGSSLSTPIAISGNDAGCIFVVESGVQAVLTGLTIENGKVAGFGGGIFNQGTLTLANDVVANNDALSSGGGLNLRVDGKGGGIYNSGTLTVNNSTLAGNSATGNGGGIDNSGMATVSNSTFSGNSAFFAGGGVLNSGTMTVSNSTFSGNSTDEGAGGISNSATMTVINSTLSGNSAGYSAGGIGNSGTLMMENTIVAGNTVATYGSDPDIDGSVNAASTNNLIGDGTGLTGISTGSNGNQVGTSGVPINPNLAALGNNGGPTQTLALQAPSTAIQRGGAITTVAQNAGGSDATIYVNNAAAIASTPGQYFILIDGEEMEVTNVDLALNTLTVTRQLNGVSATTLSTGDAVYLFADQRGDPRATPPDLGAFQYSPWATFTSTPNIKLADENSVAASGMGVNGDSISVTISDGTHTTTPQPATVSGGAWSVSGIYAASLKDGPVTYAVTETDAAGATTTITQTALKQTVATKLVVTVQPPASIGDYGAFGLAIAAEDSWGEVDPTFTGSVNVALSANPGGATLGDTRGLLLANVTNVSAQSGIATFSGLNLNAVGAGYTLQTQASGLTAATTNSFNVTALPYLKIFPLPSGQTGVSGMAFGPDGNLWFGAPGNDINGVGKIGVFNLSTHAVSEFTPPGAIPGVTWASAGFLTAGPDGNVWYSLNNADVGEVDPATDAIHQYATSGALQPYHGLGGISAAAGNIWVIDSFYGKLIEINVANPRLAGDKEFPLYSGLPSPFGKLTTGPDGNLWFPETPGTFSTSAIEEFNPITDTGNSFAVTGASINGVGITRGPDGNVWFTTAAGIGDINPTTHAISEFALPSVPTSLTSGPGGNLWFNSAAGLGVFNPTTDAVSMVAAPVGGNLTFGPDGNLWFTVGNSLYEVVASKLLAPAPIGPAGTIPASAGYDPPTFSWASAPGVNQYDLSVTDTSTGKTVMDANVNATSFTPTAPLTPGHTFEWRVAAVSTNGLASFWSAWQNFSLARAIPTVTVSDVGGIYNGHTFPASANATGLGNVSVTGTFSFKYFAGTSVSGAGSSTAPKNAGTYTVEASFTSSNPSYANGQSEPVTFTIAAPSPYTGSYAGTYSGTATVAGRTKSVTGSVDFSVTTTGMIAVTSPGPGQGAVTSSGSATLAGAGTIGGIANVSYACTGTIVIPALGLISDQGTWTAKFTGGTASGTWSATLIPAKPNVMVSDAGGTYNGQPYAANAAATGIGGATTVNGSFTYAYYAGTSVSGAGSATAPTNAGAYTVVASFSSSDPNYTNARSSPLPFTIHKAAATVTATDAGGTYDGHAFPAAATATGVGGTTIAGSFTFSYYVGSSVSGPASAVAPTGAGVYTVVASFSSGDPNYASTQSAPVPFTIAKATPAVSATDAGGPYDGAAYPAAATATGLSGAAVSGAFSFTYYPGSSVSGTGSPTAPGNVGTYTVVAAFTSSNPNYSNSQSAPVTFTIAQGTPISMGTVSIRLSGSSAPNEVTLSYVNTGATDAMAPLVILATAQGNVTFNLPGLPAHVGAIRILAGDPNGNPFGVLPPGFSNTITVQFTSKTSAPPTFTLQVQSNLNAAFNWQAVAATVPAGETAADWANVVQAAQKGIGTTWGDLLAAIGNNVSAVAGGGANGVAEGDTFYDFDNLVPYFALTAATNSEQASAADSSFQPAMSFEAAVFAPAAAYQFNPPAGFQTVSANTTAGVALYSDGPLNASPSHTYVISHGLGGMPGVDGQIPANNRFFVLAAAIREQDPNANILIVDWTPGADHVLPWPAAQNIDASGDAVASMLATNTNGIGTSDLTTTTFIGESFGNDLLARVASDFIFQGYGQVGTALVFNPASNLGGYLAPDFTTMYTQSTAFITPSLFDQQTVTANYALVLKDVPPGIISLIPGYVSYYEHTHGVAWLANNITWVTNSMPLQKGHPGGYDGTANFDGGYTSLVKPAMKAAPTPLLFAATEDGPDPAAQSFQVTNTGASGSLLHYSVPIGTFGRITVSGVPSGALAAGESATYDVSVNTAGVAPGTYDAAITVRNGDADTDETIAVIYTVRTVNPFAGSYTGSYTGTGSADGFTGVPLSGPVAFTVGENGDITVTVPGGGQGTVASSGKAQFAGAGGFGSVGDADYTFKGTFVRSAGGVVTASGSWSASASAGSGSGGWSATLA